MRRREAVDADHPRAAGGEVMRDGAADRAEADDDHIRGGDVPWTAIVRIGPGTTIAACLVASRAAAWSTWTGASPFLLTGACASKSPIPTDVLAGAGADRQAARLDQLRQPDPRPARPGSDGAAGVSVDLARTLAEQLGLPMDLLVFESARLSVEAVTTGRADIGFFAVDPQRANTIGFTAPYVLIEGAYLVRQGSPLTDNAEVDRAGHSIMVGRGSAYDLYLARALKTPSSRMRRRRRRWWTTF